MYYQKNGLDYKEEIRKNFEKNVQDIHIDNQKRFADISNNKAARFQAGLAEFNVLNGHVRKESNDFHTIHAEMHGTDKKLTIRNKMICSEFVARSLVSALYETNEYLKKQLGETSVINMPFEKEHLNRLHPQRLVSLLQKEGCLEHIPGHSFLQKLVKQDDLTKKSNIQVQKPCKIFYEELVKLAKVDKQDVSTFTAKAIEALKKYARSEKLDLNLKEPEVRDYINVSFSKMYKQISKKPNVIIQFFRELKKLLGFKPEAQEILKRTIFDLEKAHINAIKRNYVNGYEQNITQSCKKEMISAKNKHGQVSDEKTPLIKRSPYK